MKQSSISQRRIGEKLVDDPDLFNRQQVILFLIGRKGFDKQTGIIDFSRNDKTGSEQHDNQAERNRF
jgi:hypothetical protein